MKALKIIGIVLGALVALFLILGLVAPREVTTSRSIVMEAPPAVAFGVVNDLRTWEDWSPWKEMDPDMKVSMGDPAVGKGAYYTWVGEKAGSGKMSITESTPVENIKTAVSFDGMGEAQASWDFEATEGGTKATWGFHTDYPYPWNAMLLFMDFEGAINKDYDRGLELLKGMVEEKAKEMASQSSNYEIKAVEMAPRHFVGIRKTVKMPEMQDHFQSTLPKVHEAVQKKGAEMEGMPSALYYTWDEAAQETDMALAIPLKKTVAIEGMQSFELPAGKALLIEYYGDYEDIGAAHMAMDQHLASNNLKVRMPVFEEYVTDPGEEPDASKWLTKIYYPLESEN